MASKRIGILTGGGDVPGLNGVIKGVTYRAHDMGFEVVGIRRGWEGLTHLAPDKGMEDERYIVPLDLENTRKIDRTGGTWLHSSRTNPRKMKAAALPPTLDAKRAASFKTDDDRYDITPMVMDNIEKLGLDYLVPIGGDDTLSYSRSLHDAGMDIIAVPKTMDNDVQGTEYCIGFSTAITRAKDAINRQRTTIGSHERIGVFRIFGRDAGFTSLYTAFATASRCVIPEYRYDIDHLAELLAADHELNQSHYAIVITSEGAVWQGGEIGEVGEPDAFGHRHKANVSEILASQIKAITGIDTIHSDLTYDLRSGEPDLVDIFVSTSFANIAVELIANGQRGRMLAVRDGRYGHSPLPSQDDTAVSVDIDRLYDVERLRPRYDELLGKPLMLGHSVDAMTSPYAK